MAKKKLTINDLALTIDELAVMVKKGFYGMATKDDLKGMATKDDLKIIHYELERMNADIHDIKGELGPMPRLFAAQDREILGLRFRVGRLEKKVGISTR